MPIEIKELIIKATIEQPLNVGAAKKPPDTSMAPKRDDVQTMIELLTRTISNINER